MGLAVAGVEAATPLPTAVLLVALTFTALVLADDVPFALPAPAAVLVFAFVALLVVVAVAEVVAEPVAGDPDPGLIAPLRMLCSVAVSIVAAVTNPLPSRVC